MDKIYKCQDCGSEFRVSESLLMDEDGAPTGDTPWCPDCDSENVVDTLKTKDYEPSLKGYEGEFK